MSDGMSMLFRSADAIVPRSRREILADYKNVLQNIYSPAAYFKRVEQTALTLDRPVLDRGASPDERMHIGPVPLQDLALLLLLMWRMLRRQPVGLWYFAKAFVTCARRNPGALECVGRTAGMYLHLGPFSRFVIANLDEQIGKIDAGEFRSPLADPAVAGSAA